VCAESREDIEVFGSRSENTPEELAKPIKVNEELKTPFSVNIGNVDQ
jgi:hypothetical protein